MGNRESIVSKAFLLDSNRTVLAFQIIQKLRYLKHRHLEATSTTNNFDCVENLHARKDEQIMITSRICCVLEYHNLMQQTPTKQKHVESETSRGRFRLTTLVVTDPNVPETRAA
jgi:hypothetical protein